MHLASGTTVDRYVVESLLGTGGVASVYRVRHVALGTLHALKVVHIPVPSVTERLLREGRVQGKLHHPNVVSVTDLVRVRGAPGLVMEFVPGPSLDRFLRTTQLTLAQADGLARGILAGVSSAHRLGLVHRDLKPGNILLDVADDQIVPKIVDFGLAKILSADSDSPLQTRAGASLGTPAYMAPEQIDDARSVDRRADVFALGTILFELVTGQRAFSGDSVAEVHERIRRGEHAPIPTDLPPRMHQTLQAALVVEPADRIADVWTLTDRWTAGEAREHVVWGPEALANAQRIPEAAPGWPTPTPSTSTLDDAATTDGSQETWLDEGVHPSQTLPEVRPAPVATERRAGLWLALVVGCIAVGGWLAWQQGEDRSEVLAPGQVPVVTADPVVQAQFASSWEAFLDADFAESSRRLKVVRSAEPDVALVHLLAGVVYLFAGDVPSGVEATGQARRAATVDPDQPGLGLLAAVNRVQDEGSQDASLITYQQTHPDDYLGQVVAAAWCSMGGEDERCEAAHARLLEADPGQVVGWVAIARSWNDLGASDRAIAAIEVGLRDHPDDPHLLGLLGSARLATGQLEDAREALDASLRADPRQRGPKIARSQVALLARDGRWETLTAELLAPTVPASERVGVLTEAANTLTGMGRPSAALEKLAVARRIEQEEGTPLGELTVLALHAAPLFMLERYDALQDVVRQEVALCARSPEIPNAVRNRYAAFEPYMDGMIAARRGDRDAVEASIRRTRSAEVVQDRMLEALERELAVIDRDVEGIRSRDRHYWSGCERSARIGQALLRADRPDAAAESFATTLDARCRLHRADRAWLVSARVGLAEHRLAAGDLEGVASHLAAYDVLWPRPESDVPLAVRAEAVRQALPR